MLSFNPFKTWKFIKFTILKDNTKFSPRQSNANLVNLMKFQGFEVFSRTFLSFKLEISLNSPG